MRSKTNASEPAAVWQKACFVLGGLSVPALFVWRPDVAITLFSLIFGAMFAAIVGFKALALLLGLLLHRVEKTDSQTIAELQDEDCPVYTLLIPLFKEPEVVEQLTEGLQALDYPKDKLDARILVEEIDSETQAALAALDLPEWIQVLVVPDGKPRTKPRACNYGLQEARGEYVVIFDAEDRPEPDQLKKAALAFRQLPAAVICLQAYLNFYNSRQNWLTRFFTLDYTCWFDFYLPGLHVLKLPIPLGGTSNHFRIAALRDLGAWDAHNVTEDCDLGLRMARNGYETRILDSTTWEEAVVDVGPWIRQRSRWVKGYWQTLIAHTRQPILALQELGLWSFLGMLLVVGGQVFSLTFNPVCLVLLAWILIADVPIFHPESPYTIWVYRGMVAMLLANLGFIVAHAAGAWQRRQHGLMPYALLLPFYWLLMSVGAWRGVLQYFWAPFHWDKTPHGLSTANTTLQTDALPQRSSASASATCTIAFVILASFLGAIACAWYLPKLLDFDERVQHAAISLDSPAVQLEMSVEENWTQHQFLRARGILAPGSTVKRKICKAVAYLKVIDGDWYQLEYDFCEVRKAGISADFDLAAEWTPVDSARPWHTDNLRRVRSFGLRLYGLDPELHELASVEFEFDARQAQDDVQFLISNAPQKTNTFELTEIAFSLSEAYSNPFDPEIVDIRAVLISPDGETRNSIGFFTQDYERHQAGEEEQLRAVGVPRWACRFTPDQAGTWSWQLIGHDHLQRQFASKTYPIVVAASDHPGFYQVDPVDPHYFSRSDGSFFYPLMMTLRSPGDTLALVDADYTSPHPESGTFTMDAYLDRIHAAGLNTVRIWSCSWFGGLEWHKDYPGYHGLGHYNLQNAWRLDYLFRRCEELGIAIDLLVQDHGAFNIIDDSNWDMNPYNKVNGGMLSRTRDIMTSDEANELLSKRFRYTAARLGAFTSLLGWTAWVEIETVVARGHPANVTRRDRREVTDWHRKYIPALTRYDWGRHPVSTLLWGGTARSQRFGTFPRSIICRLPLTIRRTAS
ncbi:MAG: cellulose synthase/poly-beta-1,6-N-acetylglucosamine synthase-like glycosyltransferase [Rhodothermales bacterium]|jgi:cellulose synthase/poly-beta-1,6-N-acetylglucosamine synthase-like glycosyltransferase